MTDQIFDGIGSGIMNLLVVWLGFAFFKAGEVVTDHQRHYGAGPDFETGFRAFLISLGTAAFFGLLASRDFIVTSGGDGIFGGGEVVGGEVNHEPYTSFARAFLFIAVCMSIGISRGMKDMSFRVDDDSTNQKNAL